MRSDTLNAISRVLAIAGVLGIALLITLSPLEDSAAYIVSVVTGGLILAGIALVKDPHERAILIRLFCIALILRLVFTVVAYKTGLTQYLGGEDDEVWKNCWTQSRHWQGWLRHAPTRRGIPGLATLPDNLWEIYDSSRPTNLGFHYFASYLYYLINIPSQMALSFLNCSFNALTVVIIYKTAREYFTEKASYFAAMIAVILPGFLAWSALSIKETWVILLEIVAFYSILKFNKGRNPLYLMLVLGITVLVLGIRFYVAYIIVAGTLLSIACYRSARPFRTALLSFGGLLFLIGMMMALHIIHVDLAHMAQARIAEMDSFRNGASGKFNAIHGRGTASAVQLDYDISTPGGAIMMVLIGSIYLLLSPFPWQVTNARQMVALPDVFLWWCLVFGFILPGILYAWRRQPGVLLSLAGFTLPLILFYSLIFGNVGLAYRQRAQLMPFLLILAAAGYERRQREPKRSTAADRLKMPLRQRLQSLPVPTSTIT
ncbi:MAG: glycosyltransferase family 39 protein [Abitibacteriaceae bacterium]|nr:glycosyltransferase family 39 protein [Abditibacteriaceae bacterium]